MSDSTHNPGIRAIETRYAGCHFRSRLEARWAVFFDHLAIRWEYEVEGFVGAYGDPYLPDFVLPDIKHYSAPVYVEVKGSDEQLAKDSQRIGQCIDYKSTPISEGLLILGPIPRVNASVSVVTHSLCYWRKGVEHKSVEFVLQYGGKFGISHPYNHPSGYFDGNTTEELPDGVSVDARVWDAISFSHGGRPLEFRTRPNSRLLSAYEAARSARFEHGQSGAT